MTLCYGCYNNYKHVLHKQLVCVVFAIFAVNMCWVCRFRSYWGYVHHSTTRCGYPFVGTKFFFFFLTWYILLVMDVLKNNSVNYRRKQIIRIHVKDMIHNYIHLFAWFNNFFFIINPIWESCFISDVLIFPEQDFGFFFTSQVHQDKTLLNKDLILYHNS